MGDRIEFPHNHRMAEKYFNEAIAYMDNDQEAEALEKVEKLYAYDKQSKVVYLYTTLLGSMGRYEEALDIANTKKDFFMQDPDAITIYTVLLIANGLYIEAENIILKHLKKGTPSEKEDWEELYDNLKLNRAENIKAQEAHNQKTKSMLMRIENYSVQDHIGIMKEAKHLTLSDLQKVAARMFHHPYINGIIQRLFLEVLVEKQDDQKYTFLFFNEHKTIQPSKLTLFDDDPHVKKVQDELERQLEKHPALKEPIQTEIINDLLLLYPFVGETIPDIPFFINYYIHYYDVNNMVVEKMKVTTKAQEKVAKWLNVLNNLSGRPNI